MVGTNPMDLPLILLPFKKSLAAAAFLKRINTFILMGVKDRKSSQHSYNPII